MDLEERLRQWAGGRERLVFLTGAGISAESGIPTFRGPGGFWRVGSENHSPMDLATRAMFDREPETVWAWYLARFAACSAAEPNAAHRAIARVQAHFGDRVALVTQNIDALHTRAGSPPGQTYAIHGDARFVRCSASCDRSLRPMPAVERPTESHVLPDATRARLRCDRCAAWLRPHVLWFDEYYEEELYRSDSARRAAGTATLLVTVGTTGTTSLPMTIATACHARGVAIVDVNIDTNPFAALASKQGACLTEPATAALPKIARWLGVHP